MVVAERLTGLQLPHLRAWRARRALTQNELAERAGVARNTVARTERGEVARFPTVRKFAEALGITVEQLQHAPTDDA